MSVAEKFRADEDEQLIELVHANPCLWNMADPDFKKEKRFLWADIGRSLTVRRRSGVECKSRWRSIRDYYKKQKKDEKSGNQAPAVKRRQVYWNSLKFLDDADDELKALSNVHVEISEDAEVMDLLHYENPDIRDVGEIPMIIVPPKRRKFKREDLRENFDEEENLRVGINEDEKTEETLDLISDNLECQLKDKFKQIKEGRTTQDNDIKSIVSEQEGVDDDIDLFFRAMAATVKKFPPKLKVVSKARIFAVVNELEVTHLESTSQYQSYMEEQGE